MAEFQALPFDVYVDVERKKILVNLYQSGRIQYELRLDETAVTHLISGLCNGVRQLRELDHSNIIESG